MNRDLINRAALATAIICGTFSLFIAFQLVSNCIALKEADPLNMELFGELRQQLHRDKSNDILKQEIRDLDLLARRTFFASIKFQDNGTMLLLISLIMTTAALKIFAKINSRPTAPGKFKAQDQSVEAAAVARHATWAAVAIIIAFTFIVGLQTETDRPEQPDDQGGQPPKAALAPLDMSSSWPNLRGPYGLGIAASTNMPTDWDGASGRNILWKMPVPRAGHNSPIVISNRVFISCADAEAREILCFDGDTGSILWQKEVGIVPGDPGNLPDVMEDVSLAAPTMATDGHHVFAAFATGNVICFDLEANRKWATNVGPFDNEYGYASSLITYKGLLIMQIDEADLSRVLALKIADGKTAWETYRDVIASWCTPILADTDMGMQLILNGHPLSAAYNPETGHEIWSMETIEDGEVAPSPAYANGIAYVTTEFQPLSAIKIGAEPEVLWTAEGDFPDVSSPLATGDHIFLGSSSAVITCVDASNGEILWTHDTPEGFYASPVLIGEHVYLMDKTGVMHIFEATGTYKPLASPALGEDASSTPAFVNGSIYIRANKHLYCVGNNE